MKSKIQPLFIKMSRARSQKRKTNHQDSADKVSEDIISPVAIGNSGLLDQDVLDAGPWSAKSPRLENSVLKSMTASLKEEITSEIKNVLVDFQKEMLKLLKPKTGENAKEEDENELENETRSFYTPTKVSEDKHYSK